MTAGAYVSYDGLDATMRTVNNDPGISCPNANWNGASTNYCSGVTGDDTVAHEWGHAYTEYTNGLIYQWQSGALNESYSDMWGEVVDLLNGRGTDAPGGVRTVNTCSVYTPAPAILTVNSPAGIAGDYAVGTALFGPAIDGTLTGDVMIVDDGGAIPSEGCAALNNDLTGKIAFVRRGTCGFAIKVKNAQDAGAIGAIVANHATGGDALTNMAGDDPTITIQSLFIGNSDGNAIESEVGGSTVNVTFALDIPGTPEASYRWLSGEDDPAFGGAIRDMWDPTCHGDPGKVSDTEYWCSTDDSGGVHTNSGVPNHAFALLVDGGTYNGQTIAALGLTKTSHLHWAAQNMLTPSSTFMDHANALAASCTALTGVNLAALSTSMADAGASGEIITAADCAEVDKAILAVEFNTEPAACEFGPLLDPEAPPLCTQANGAIESILTEDWEGGTLPAGWTVGSHDVANVDTFDTPDWAVVDSLPAGALGTYAAFAPDLVIGDCAADDESGAIYLDSPVITVPAGASVPRVAFDHWVATEGGWDGGNVKISVNGGPWTVVPTHAFDFNAYNSSLATAGGGNTNPLAGEAAFTGTDGGELHGSWGQSQVNLGGMAFPGDEVQFRFDFGVDGCNGLTGWYVDDVEVYSCSEEVGAPRIEVDQTAYSASFAPDQVHTTGMTVMNTGTADLNWDLVEDNKPTTRLGAGKASVETAPLADPGVVAGLLSSAIGLDTSGLISPERAPLVVPPGLVTITHSISQTILPEHSVACGPGASNSFLRVFDLVTDFDINTSFEVMEVDVGIQMALSAGSTQPVTVNLYTLSGVFVYANMTLIGSATVDVISQTLSIVTVPVTGIAPPGSVLVVEVETSVDDDLWIGSNDGGEASPSFIAAGACGFPDPLTFGAIGYPDVHVVMNVRGEVLDDPCLNPVDVPWLSMSPTGGVTAPGTADDVTLTLDSTGLSTGLYQSTICVESDDPVTPRIQVPVDLTVVEAAAPEPVSCDGVVGFEGGIPGDWSVWDNAGNGLVWTDIPGSGELFNYTGGAGDAATVSSDQYGPAGFDTEMRSGVISLPANNAITLDYVANYQIFSGADFLDVDISDDGGLNWVNVSSWNEDHGAFRSLPGEAVSLDLSAYAGSDVMLRWRYSNPASGAWDWYAQVDEVGLTCEEPSISLTKTVGVDTSVCAADDSIIILSPQDVTYCYVVENTGNVALNLHTLDDSELGTFFSDLPFNLTPGSSAWLTATVNITDTTVNQATWTARVAGGPQVSATDTATVTLELRPTDVSLSQFGGQPAWQQTLWLLLAFSGVLGLALFMRRRLEQ